MTEHVVDTAERCGLLPLIVTKCDDVAEWGVGRGLPTVPDPGAGLSAAAEAGVSWAEASGSIWLVLHGDLPLLAPGDLDELAGHLRNRLEPIAPSADGGTSALGSRERVRFSYGIASFHRHLTRLRSPRVVVRSGLAHDIDTPADLEAAATHPRGAWLHRALG